MAKASASGATRTRGHCVDGCASGGRTRAEEGARDRIEANDDLGGASLCRELLRLCEQHTRLATIDGEDLAVDGELADLGVLGHVAGHRVAAVLGELLKGDCSSGRTRGDISSGAGTDAKVPNSIAGHALPAL